MKVIYTFLCLFFILINSKSQSDTIRIEVDYKELYKDEYYEKLTNLLSQSNLEEHLHKCINFDYIDSLNYKNLSTIPDDFTYTIPIPIVTFNSKIKLFNCGDLFEDIINFDPIENNFSLIYKNNQHYLMTDFNIGEKELRILVNYWNNNIDDYFFIAGKSSNIRQIYCIKNGELFIYDVKKNKFINPYTEYDYSTDLFRELKNKSISIIGNYSKLYSFCPKKQPNKKRPYLKVIQKNKELFLQNRIDK